VLKPCEESYKIAGEAIKQGKAIIVPTDAVYAVVCDAFNKDAVTKSHALYNICRCYSFFILLPELLFKINCETY
jgi:hypothetical protein